MLNKICNGDRVASEFVSRIITVILLADPEIKIGEATDICSARFNSKKMTNEFQQVSESLMIKSFTSIHE